MKNMKVSAKLLSSFLIVIILALLVGIFGIVGMNSINNADDDMYNYNLVAISAMGDFREAFQMERTQLRAMILAVGNTDDVQAAIDEIGALEMKVAAAMATYETTITDDAEEDGYHAAKNAYTGEYVSAKKGIYEAALAGEFDLAYQRLKDAGSLAAPIADGLTRSAKANGDWAKDAVNANTDLFTRMTIIEIALLVVAVVAAIFLAFYISSLISKPLNILSSFMQKAGSTGDISLRPEDIENISKFSQNKDETGVCIASTAKFIQHITTISDELDSISNGDLTTSVEVLSGNDVMGVSMQKMVDNLNQMFGEINASASQVATGSKQIADGSQSLAQGSTEQAAAVEELSSSIAEIAEKTKINAQMAGKAANLANTIMGSAQKGSVQMDEMMSAVKEINQASQSINKVIKVIDDIAFQTNILALNAAVEAARAGQHGKGFAVVAEEVRNLAAKSAEAAKDTSGLIANSMEKAELGARIADETASSLAEIVSGINESNQLVGDIARSSDEQSEGISQINKGIDQVAQVIQQNSATAEESAAASQEMSGQSDMLESLISQFKLKDGGTARRQIAAGASRQRPTQTRGIEDYDSFGDYGKY